MTRTVPRWLVLAALAAAAMGCSMHHRPATDDGMADDDMAMDHEEMNDDDMSMDDDMAGDDEYAGKVCGGIQGLPCPDGYFCELPAGECRSADLQGECVAQPEVCTKIYKPVCGCDGMTYGNDCERRAAGVQKDHDGECK